jgi:hypothetical protein
MMDLAALDAQRWREMGERVTRLEAEGRELKRRTLVAAGLNALLLLSLACWLAWPGKSLMTKRLTAQVVDAESIVTAHAALRPDGLVLMGSQEPSSIRLSTADPDAPALVMQHDRAGQIVASVGDAPFIGLYGPADNGDQSRQPRIELSVDPRDQSPHIVLRDVSGQVVWQAP